MKFITLSTDPSSYGSEFNPDDLKPLNSKIRQAAESAGVTVFEADPHQTSKISEDERDAGNEELDWFKHWCSTAYRYNGIQWSSWFRKQLAE